MAHNLQERKGTPDEIDGEATKTAKGRGPRHQGVSGPKKFIHAVIQQCSQHLRPKPSSGKD